MTAKTLDINGRFPIFSRSWYQYRSNPNSEWKVLRHEIAKVTARIEGVHLRMFPGYFDSGGTDNKKGGDNNKAEIAVRRMWLLWVRVLPVWLPR
jgi:hypothetical protein